MKKLPRSFYNRNTLDVAIDLLGCKIVSNVGAIKTGGIIVETEAYHGPDDPACHAFHGLSRRNHVMFGPPGFLYVYFTYGNHHMLNVVCEMDGFPAAVLLRAVEPRIGVESMAHRRHTTDPFNIASGPGKLARALGVTLNENGCDLTENSIYISGPAISQSQIFTSPRIGIGNRGHKKLWRFVLNGNPHISKPSKYVRENLLPLDVARQRSFTLK
jgi:DNA-3-methyladenine glycosylase